MQVYYLLSASFSIVFFHGMMHQLFMKKLTLLCTLLISYSSFSYELISFSSSRVRTPEEILRETNIAKEQIENFKCDNTDRYELFAQTPIQNMAKDSLKISDTKGNIFTYANGLLLGSNNRPLTKIKDRFLKQALNTLKRFETVPELRQLIEELQYSPYNFYIQLGGNRYSPNEHGQRQNTHGNDAGLISMFDELRPMVDGMPFGQIGFGGFIYWNPKTDASFVEADYVIRKVDVDLILAHEMYHAYDGMRGLLDRRFVKNVEDERYEFQPVCEYRAVRLENIARKALGYKYRRYYSENQGSPNDMLDDNDEPEVMPTPCIQWL